MRDILADLFLTFVLAIIVSGAISIFYVENKLIAANMFDMNCWLGIAAAITAVLREVLTSEPKDL